MTGFNHKIDFKYEDISLQFNLKKGELAEIVSSSGDTRSLIVSILSLKQIPH